VVEAARMAAVRLVAAPGLNLAVCGWRDDLGPAGGVACAVDGGWPGWARVDAGVAAGPAELHL